MIQLSPTFDEKTFGFGQFKAFLAEAQKKKIIHIGKEVTGVPPISLGRAGRLLEDEGEAEGRARGASRAQEDQKAAEAVIG